MRDVQGRRLRIGAHDFLVAGDRSAIGLVLLAFAEAAGVRALNSYAATRVARDKVELAIALSRAGLPAPPTFIADDVVSLATLPADAYPLISRRGTATMARGCASCAARRRSPTSGGAPTWSSPTLAMRGDEEIYQVGLKYMASRRPPPLLRLAFWRRGYDRLLPISGDAEKCEDFSQFLNGWREHRTGSLPCPSRQYRTEAADQDLIGSARRALGLPTGRKGIALATLLLGMWIGTYFVVEWAFSANALLYLLLAVLGVCALFAYAYWKAGTERKHLSRRRR